MKKNDINIGLSKSLYTRGLQCEKSLWLKKYNPEVLTPPDAQLQAVFETGNLVGDKACELFPEGKEVPYEGKNHAKNIELTQKLLSEGVKNIYEATFEYDGILVLIDIFHHFYLTNQHLPLYLFFQYFLYALYNLWV